jgi:hypothetical protein
VPRPMYETSPCAPQCFGTDLFCDKPSAQPALWEAVVNSLDAGAPTSTHEDLGWGNIDMVPDTFLMQR